MTQGFDVFVAASSPRLNRAARMLLGSAAESQDLAQECLIVVYRHWDRLRDRQAAEAYAYTVLTLLVRRHLRRARFRHEVLSRDTSSEHQVADGSASAGGDGQVAAALARLPARQREAIALRFYLDMSIEETARVMRCSPGVEGGRTVNTDHISTELKDTAASWHSPALDAVVIRNMVENRRRRNRRIAVTSPLAVLLVAGLVTGADLSRPAKHRNPSAQPGGTGGRAQLSQAMAPGGPPTVFIRPTRRTGQQIAGEPVLARTSGGTSATVQTRLSFRTHAPGRVKDTAIVVCRPSTQPAATSQRTTPGTGDYYRAMRVAISSFVNATAPHTTTLTVTTPSDLPPGTYPVLTDIHTDLLPGQRSGIDGPYFITGEIGVIIITRH